MRYRDGKIKLEVYAIYKLSYDEIVIVEQSYKKEIM